MSQASPANQPARGAPQECDDTTPPAILIARAEQRLTMLRELAELGMAMARDTTRRALERPASTEQAAVPRHDPADSFARISRAVRLTLVLEAKAEEELRALIAGERSRAADKPSADVPAAAPDDNPSFHLPTDHPSAHRNTIRDNVYDAINREVDEPEPAREILDTLYERLTEGERYDAFIHRPLKEAVAAICEDLDLHPDWSRWGEAGFLEPTETPRRAWHRMWKPHRRAIEARREATRRAAADNDPPNRTRI